MLPMTSRLASLVPAFALVVQIGEANAQSLPPAKPGGAALHHAAKAKLRVAASSAPAPGGQGRATEASFGHMDDWFSYGPPKEAEVERAEKMVAAYDAAYAAGLGAVKFEGAMIDVPVVNRARTVLKRAAGLRGRNS